MVAESRLHRMHRAVGLGQTFDGHDRAALGLHGKHVATFDRSTVHVNRTGTTLRGVATDVGSGQTQRIADEVHQQQARFHFGADGFSVDGHGKPDWHGFSLLGGEGRQQPAKVQS